MDGVEIHDIARYTRRRLRLRAVDGGSIPPISTQHTKAPPIGGAFVVSTSQRVTAVSPFVIRRWPRS